MEDGYLFGVDTNGTACTQAVSFSALHPYTTVLLSSWLYSKPQLTTTPNTDEHEMEDINEYSGHHDHVREVVYTKINT